MIRTALLCIPEIDDAALDSLRGLLRTIQGVVIIEERAVTSQRTWIAETLRGWCDEAEMDLVLTLGGTLPASGPSAVEVVPEATLEVLDRLAPALPEAMRAAAFAASPIALLDRGVAGIRSHTLLINLPEGVAATFWLDPIIDVIPAYVAHLQGDAEAPRLEELDYLAEEFGGLESVAETPNSAKGASKALKPDEFEAFLKRKKD